MEHKNNALFSHKIQIFIACFDSLVEFNFFSEKIPVFLAKFPDFFPDVIQKS